MSVEKLLGEIEGRAKAAEAEVYNICAGAQGFRMSVPVRQTDSDIVLSDSLNDSPRLIAALRRAIARLEDLKNKSQDGWEIRDSVAFASHSLEEVTRILQGQVKS